MNLVVVGPGRVGSAFLQAAASAGLEAGIVARGGPTGLLASVHPGVPIVVATRADALREVVAATAEANRADLVFLQNGMILPLLAELGLAEATQGLIYFAATDRSGAVQAGRDSIFCGRHAAFLVTLLERAAIPARVEADPVEYRREFAAKMSWNLVFGLLGDTFGEPVGRIATLHRDAVEALVTEITPVLARAVGAPLSAPDILAANLAYSMAIPDFRAQVREPSWRNGWLAAAAVEAGLPVPLHARLLAALTTP